MTETTDPMENRVFEAQDPRERRLVLRLLSYWRDVCGERDMPSPGDIDGAAIPDMWDYCFVIAVDGDAKGRFESVGDWHAEFHGGPASGIGVAEVGESTLLGRSTNYLEEVVTRKIPVTYGGEFLNNVGDEILYRSILLPLSEDGTKVSAILGGANCRVTKAEDKENLD